MGSTATDETRAGQRQAARAAQRCILQTAVPSPLNRTFDYLPPADCDPASLRPGMRVRIPFGNSSRIGLIMAISDSSSVEPSRLKAALAVLDDEPLLPPGIVALLDWAGRYYHHAPGNVINNALPALLRQGHAARPARTTRWRLTDAGRAVAPGTLQRAPRQRQLLHCLAEHADGATAGDLEALGSWRSAMKALSDKGWVERLEIAPATETAAGPVALRHDVTLNAAQQQAVATVQAALGRFAAFLLEGVTGSGKTEVYFRLVEQVLAAGRQALLLVPEIGLTPQLVGRVQARFAVPLAVLHSGLGDRERLDAWLAARSGRARIVIGTRSAVFVPLAEPGLIIVDEEHDSSFKQMDGFRYHARDVAVIRARRDGVPIVLGSATPSLESLYNVEQGRYTALRLPHRVGTALTPAISLLDVRHLAFDDGLSAQLLETMRRHLDNDSQVLLFLNRRGYAPTLLCHDCGWLARCERCDAHLIYHQQRGLLRCHHCDAQRPVDATCPACGSRELLPVGHGTERIEAALQTRFPDTDIIRIDRDSTRGKGRLQDLLTRVNNGRRQILIGTQMLAKGHHLPNVTLVAIVSADQGLFSIDFRASERLGQTVIQVAGRAGRADKPGEVLIQTHHPEHPLLQLLVRHDYPHYARHLLDERRAIPLPPYVHMAIVRAEAVGREQPQRFLEALERQATAWQIPGVDLLGPMPAIMERRAGRYRALLVIQAGERKPLHRLLTRLVQHIDTLPRNRHVRWSLDVDPVDMY